MNTHEEFCQCKAPKIVDDTIHVQEAGDIVEKIIGKYCEICNLPYIKEGGEDE